VVLTDIKRPSSVETKEFPDRETEHKGTRHGSPISGARWQSRYEFKLTVMRRISAGKALLKLALSRGTQLALRGAVNRTKGRILSLGSSVECPICKRTFLSFLRFRGRPNQWCPVCRSLGRHRLIYLYLRNRTDLLTGRQPARILHVGPEFCLQVLLASIPKATYVSTDLMVSMVDLLEVAPEVCTSITQACFRSNTFDLVICSHVLEHVKRDRQAITELFRVTKPGGIAIIPVPVAWNHETTDEREDLSPSERAEFYGAADHLRRYGRDYLDRLEEAGFATELYRLEDLSLVKRYRIDVDDPLVLAQKSTAFFCQRLSEQSNGTE
jgi:SAM-dependent methyltransferase